MRGAHLVHVLHEEIFGEMIGHCCAAQMFLDSGDGVVFKGNIGPWYAPKTGEFHLNATAARTLLEQALVEQGESRTALANRALSVARAALEVDPEHAQAWWLVNRSATELGDEATAANAREKHARYKPDENARDRAVRLAREKYPWANAAAEATVLYPMQRDGRLTGDLRPGTRVEVQK
jgi:hypothetical protein